MGNNDAKGSTVKLWDQKFRIVKKGLDEAEVVSFVSRLMGERDQLLQQGRHFSALTKLAERTIVESDKLAEEIKKEAADKAKVEADAVIARAEEQAQQIIEEKRVEIMTAVTEEAEAIKHNAEKEAEAIKNNAEAIKADAEKEAETIKANAEKEMELLVKNQRQKIQPELKDMTQRVYNELLSQLDGLKQQAIALREEFEQKLPQLVEEISQEPVSEQVSAIIKQEDDTVSADDSEENIEEVGVSAEAQQPAQEIDQIDTDKLDEKTPASVDSQEATLYNGEVELEILPPINIMQIIVIMQYLDNLSEIESTELIPLYDKPSIIASLREPLPLLDILSTLPEIEEVKGDADGGTVSSDDVAEGKRRKIRIRLFEGKSVIDEAKERLNNEVSNILSEAPDSNKN